MVLEKTLEGWTSRRSNQSILKQISPEWSLEGLMLKLKLQYFGHLMRRVDSLERLWYQEGLGAGGKGDDRGWDGWMASPCQWTWVSELRELVIDREAWHAAIHVVTKSDLTEWMNWTELNWEVQDAQWSLISCLELSSTDIFFSRISNSLIILLFASYRSLSESE